MKAVTYITENTIMKFYDRLRKAMRSAWLKSLPKRLARMLFNKGALIHHGYAFT